jgi:HPt (histidine-containing phosphotransfer) domain-containing protein
VSAPMPSDRLQQGLQALRDGFLERITARCLAIESILAAVAEGDAELVTDADRKSIQLHAHKTAGVAATFGFSVLGDKALMVEQIMSRTEADLPWSVVRPEVEALLDEMEDALDEFA